MFLNTFTDARELIYVRTKDYLFWSLRSRVFDFWRRGKKTNSWYIFLSQEANRGPAIKKTNICSICHQDVKRACYQMFHNSASLGGGTIDMLSNLPYVRVAANELRLHPFSNLCLTFRICPSSGYWSKIFFNCWISDGWMRLKPDEKSFISNLFFRLEYDKLEFLTLINGTL